jgi:hypothetical protein
MPEQVSARSTINAITSQLLAQPATIAQLDSVSVLEATPGVQLRANALPSQVVVQPKTTVATV